MSVLPCNHIYPMIRPRKACKRPCHDCPFRADRPGWQSPAQAENNKTYLLNPFGVAICHQTGIELAT
jgi:hypothetical protein